MSCQPVSTPPNAGVTSPQLSGFLSQWEDLNQGSHVCGTSTNTWLYVPSPMAKGIFEVSVSLEMIPCSDWSLFSRIPHVLESNGLHLMLCPYCSEYMNLKLQHWGQSNPISITPVGICTSCSHDTSPCSSGSQVHKEEMIFFLEVIERPLDQPNTGTVWALWAQDYRTPGIKEMRQGRLA